MKRILGVALFLGIIAGYLLTFPPAPPWGGRNVKAVQPIYGGVLSSYPVTTGDVLWFQNTCQISTVATFIVNYKMIKESDGQIFQDQVAPGSATFNPGAGAGFGTALPYSGWLVSAETIISAGTVPVGNCYGQLMILNAMPAGGNRASAVGVPAGSITHVLFGNCINSFFAYSWPGSGGAALPTSCAPLNQDLAVSNPAAGANFLQAIGNGQRARIVNIQYKLVTSATAGNRFACVNFLTGGTGGTVIGQQCAPYAQQPSSTVVYNFSSATGWATNCSFLGGTQTAVQCPDITVPMAQYWESGGQETFAINSAVLTELGANGLAAGDQISIIHIREQSWNEID